MSTLERPAPRSGVNTRRSFLTGAAALGLAAADRRRPPAPPDVIVLGAGLSGLHAALLLEELGARVTVLEARRRVGGRVITLDQIPGRPEAGATVIGGLYARTLDRANQLGVELEIPPRFRPGHRATRILNIQNQWVLDADWARSAANPFPDKYKSLAPDLILSRLTTEDGVLSAPDDWLGPGKASYDIPTREFLARKGLSDAALRLIDTATFTNGIQWSSALHDMRVYHWLVSNLDEQVRGARRVKGGMLRLPEAMAAALKAPVQFGRAAIGVRATAAGVEVMCADGSVHHARFLICSLPFSCVRRLSFDPAPRGAQAEAIEQLPYLHTVQIHLAPRRAFWEQDGMPPGMWTDSPIENVRAEGNGPSGEITSFACDVSGRAADKFAFMSDEEIGAYVLRHLARLRPSTDGALEVHTIVNKQRDRFAAGDWHFWNAGQITRFGRQMREPFGPIHFAGEHTAIANRGMEAAMESGERAAMEIAERMT